MKYLIVSILIAYCNFSLKAESQNTIKVNVKGLVCDFCARSVEKTFGKQDYIEKIYIDLENGYIELEIKDGFNLTNNEIKKFVEINGYTLDSIERAHDK